MPEVDRRTEETILLFQRCRENKCLPAAGGVLDQPEDVMRSFDVIDGRVAAFKSKGNEDAEREAELENLRREMKHGRR